MIRLRQGIIQIYADARWKDVPAGVTGGVITAIGIGAYAIAHFTGEWPRWARLAALVVLLGPPLVVVVAIAWERVRSSIGAGKTTDISGD